MIIECEVCGREAVADKQITDGAYLYTQYGWTYHKPTENEIFILCPVCEFGEEEGNVLLDQIEEIKKLRIEHNVTL